MLESKWERLAPAVGVSVEEANSLIGPHGFVAVACEPIAEGKANSNSKITLCDGGRVVLRLHTRNPEAAELEAKLCQSFAGRLPVPSILARDHGSDPRWTLLEWMPGTTMERLLIEGKTDQVVNAAFDLGQSLATIASLTFPKSGFLGSDLRVRDPWSSVMDGLMGYYDSCASTAELAPELARRMSKRIEGDLPDLREATAQPCLSHADYKPSNLLIDDSGVSAILDWEFAHAGTWLLDAGQLFRHRSHLPSIFRVGFEQGFREVAPMPEGWFRMAQTIDLVNLVGFLSRPAVGKNLKNDVTALIERTLEDNITE